jgi:hypothetical protein
MALRARTILACLSVFLLVMQGCAGQKHSMLGLRTREQCDSDSDIKLDSQRMTCYRAAAITLAFAKDKDGAMNTCRDIYSLFYGNNKESDTASQASLMSNSCYQEIAKIFGDETICDSVDKRDTLSSGFFGETVNKQLCKDQVKNMNKTTQANSDICGLVFVLPLLAFAVLARR